MPRKKGDSLLLVGLVAVASCLVGQAAPPKAPSPADPGRLRFCLVDGSVVTGRLAGGRLLVATDSGRTEVPAAGMLGFTLGVDSRPELATRVQTLIRALGKDNWRQREKAQKELIEIGPCLRPVIEAYADDGDAERRVRLAAILQAYTRWEKDHPDALITATRPIRPRSEVRTCSGVLAGHVLDRQLKIDSPYGPVTVEVAQVHEATKPRPVAERPCKTLQISARLRAGATLTGQPIFTRFQLQTALGKLTVPLHSVFGVAVSQTGNRAHVMLRNGDRLVGRPQWPPIRIRTASGPVVVSPGNLTALDVHAGALKEGLAFHWSFDDKTATDAVTGAKGTVFPAVTFEKGVVGRAPVFRSCKTRIVIDSPKWNMNGWQQVTLSVWVKMNSYSTYGRIIGRAGGSQGYSVGMSVGGDYGHWTGGMFTVRFSEKDFSVVYPATFGKKIRPYPKKNVWYHLVGTYDGRHLRCYVNGALDGSVQLETPGRTIWDRPDAKTVIGRAAGKKYESWRDTYFPGLIDEVKIWWRALTQAEVQRLYRDTLARSAPREDEGQ